MPPSKGSKGCWTCKERKIACDRQSPRCRICLGSGRECKGYGMRLSWPRKDDRKRFLVATSRKRSNRSISLMAEFVNVFFSDIERLHDILDPSVKLTRISVLPRLTRNPGWMPFPLADAEANLFSYYQNIVSPVLTSVNNPLVRNLLIRMSFSDGTPAAFAIIYSIFALASIHLMDRSGAQMYKSKAINAIRASAAQRDELRRIVAVNLLAMFETLVTTDTPPGWTRCICFSKTASIATCDLDQPHTGDLALVLDWVYYFDVLSKFSVLHYDRREQCALDCAKREHLMVAAMNSPDMTNIVPTLGCSLEVWGTISSLINTMLNMQEDDDPHTEALNRLERRLKYAEQDIKVEELDSNSLDKMQQTRDIAELYRLAALIYLNRAGYNTAISNPALQTITESAFAILDKLHTCERTFPLFIVSCEARTDVQRATVLRLMNTTRTRFAATNIMRVHGYVERFWALDELDVGRDTEYADKVTAVLSSREAIPVFA
ncbi:hypothetical protein P280DRAFT_520824 [Massarina eburnea CBS 473.64]|uniref:Zn(2)-C6 fungal-type domain-containing protein n=1 Tax=Massarina eburnea CBS 473.64 TaxID=1395130 RepID=A0A6A6RQR3_9PLEO|nr:hypothetical protein P280DRAFT_520824 [Massarina eburnea CBS 473.64]